MKQLDPVLLLLAGMMVFFTGALFFVSTQLKTDGQTFQVISSLLTGISGAFLGRIMPKKDHPEGSTTITRELNITGPTPEKPKPDSHD